MFTKAAATKKLGYQEGFRWRGEDISRIEGLSDAVFAFALTLLIVSLEVPKTFDDLIFTLKGFVAFAACFLQLMTVWYQQYLYYRRYNLQDMTSLVLTMFLLFVVLFYTFPLKFVFMAWLGPTRPGMAPAITSAEQLGVTFTIYGIGYVLVFFTFAALNFHAYRNRELLELNDLEIWDTLHSIRETLMFVSIGLLSILLANILEGDLVNFAGPTYSLLGIVAWTHGVWSGKRRKKIEERILKSAPVLA